jgi:O-antigen/teichoic acid export membrane protein
MSNSLGTTEVALVSSVSALLDKGGAAEAPLSDVSHKDLKRRTAHGAVVSIGAQVANFVLRTGSMMILARLLFPKDFGLVGMVTAFTGFLGLFRDAGLSMATIQRASVTDAQTSTLFWINVAFGGMLAALTVVAAPILSLFYHEPRLFWVTVALGTGFMFNGVGAQHRALLQRSMRFAALVAVDIVSLIAGIAAAIGMAWVGWGYWALVVLNVAPPAVSIVALWLATRWVPGRPQRRSGIRSMLWFGGTITLNNVVCYVAYNADKVLLGRFWGADALGIYGRAYQLINLPTENLNSTLGTVAFPALSRVQNDPKRLRRYFLQGYSLFLAIAVPITVECALFSDDLIRVALGAKWSAAAEIFRLLAPTILAFAILNPLAWLMLALGQAVKSLKIALLSAPIVILGYAIGISRGPHGVATGYSLAMLLLIVPLVTWAKRGTLITWNDILKAVGIPFLSVAAGAGVIWLLAGQLVQLEPALLRLTAESAILFATYFVMLMFVFRQWTIYNTLLRETGLWGGGQRPKEKVQ